MRKKINLVKILISIIVVLVVLITIISVTVAIKGNGVNAQINNFKDRGEYVFTKAIKNDNSGKDEIYNFYKVVAKSKEEKETDKIYNNSIEEKSIGTTGDIYLTTSDPFGTMFTKWMSNKIFIGHAGIVYSEDACEVAEIYGNSSDNAVKVYKNDWFDIKNDKFIILRSKQHINKKEITKWIDNHIECKYNYLYFLKTKNRYYCTDLISRCYDESQNLNISNKNRMITGESMINNIDTFIIYYKEKSSDVGVDYNVYFLSEE